MTKSSLLILAVILMASALVVSTNVYQSVWYIGRDDSQKPPRHYIGMKVLQTSDELSYFWNADIQKDDPYFRVRIDRTIDSTTFAESSYAFNGDYNRFNKQFVHYFPTSQLYDYRGGYFVLEDDDSDNFQSECIVRFYVTYFQTYQQAKFRYESLKLENKNYKLYLGGPSSVHETTDETYFQTRYLSYWCSHSYGIINGNFENSSFPTESKRVIIWTDSLADVNYNNYNSPFSSNDFQIPINSNNYDLATYPEALTVPCTFGGSNHIYIPSEFYAHCSNFKWDINWHSVDILYLYCFNNTPSSNSEYYRKAGYCTSGNKFYLKLQNIYDNIKNSDIKLLWNFQCQVNTQGTLQALETDRINYLTTNSITYRTLFENHGSFVTIYEFVSTNYSSLLQCTDNLNNCSSNLLVTNCLFRFDNGINGGDSPILNYIINFSNNITGSGPSYYNDVTLQIKLVLPDFNSPF